MATASFIPSDTTPAAIEFALLQSWLASSSALQLPLHQIETQQQAKGREVQLLLLQAHLQQRGNGDGGTALCLQHQDGEVLYSHRRLGARSLPTVFGTVELVRMGYSRPGAPSIFPLDQALALPARAFSYELQRRLVKAAVQNPFLESVQTMADLTGVSVSQRSLEEILPDAAQDFDAFYRQPSPVPATGSILVAAVDCKGIPMVKPAGTQPVLRLTKGQKANKKRMATVAVVFTRSPWVRTPQQVVESLFPTGRRTPGDGPTPPRPENKRVWASLLKGKTAVIQEVAEEMERRDPSATKTRIALSQRQQIKVSTRLVRGGVNGVIPVAMKFVLFQVHSPNFLIRHLPAGRVFPTIQTAGHVEPFGCRRARDQIHDRLIIAKRLAAPIRGDEREKPVFQIVPFAGARRKVTDGNRKARFIR